jgi:hypothetical protein
MKYKLKKLHKKSRIYDTYTAMTRVCCFMALFPVVTHIQHKIFLVFLHLYVPLLFRSSLLCLLNVTTYL